MEEGEALCSDELIYIFGQRHYIVNFYINRHDQKTGSPATAHRGCHLHHLHLQ